MLSPLLSALQWITIAAPRATMAQELRYALLMTVARRGRTG
jgi:hypothetical protein